MHRLSDRVLTHNTCFIIIVFRFDRQVDRARFAVNTRELLQWHRLLLTGYAHLQRGRVIIQKRVRYLRYHRLNQFLADFAVTSTTVPLTTLPLLCEATGLRTDLVLTV